jgi:hypothetical protein
MGKRKQYTNAEKVALARKASLLGCSIASVACGDGFTSIYRMRLYKKHKETRRKFSNQKQLESNPQGQDSYNNESSNTFL